MPLFSRINKSDRIKGGSNGPVGRKGEDAAIRYLKAGGYTIREKNYRRRFGEIDIVADDNGVLVFIEVKTRRSDRYGSPFEAVDFRKQQKLSRVALDYISRHRQENVPARFDVVAVILKDGQPPQIELIRDAFEFCG